MSGDEEKIREIKNNLSEFDLRGLNLANFTPKEEVRFHEYIKGICQRLLGDTINLDAKNIIFALSDKDEANAACASKGEVSIIYITEKLLDLCQNEDQLAFILGHELGHYEERLRQGAGKQNSKAEEAACDLRAIQKMARGGYNLEEACNIAAEIFDKQQISIDDLKDPHTNDNSRVNLINAMKKKEKDRIIEEQNIEVTQSTPIPEDIIEIVHNRPKQRPLFQTLVPQMQQIPDDKDRVDFLLKIFHAQVISNGNYYAMTKDDIKDFAYAVNSCLFRSNKFADEFLAAVFADMRSMQTDNKYNACVEIMHDILDNIYSSDDPNCSTTLDAGEKDCKTAVWLRHYLRGFREAQGEKFDDMIQNLEFVKKFVAHHNGDSYKGIYVKNFNILELDFNENDVGKRLSPQVLKYIKSNINAFDKFVTFSGLTVNKMGDSLVFKHEKNNWCVFVDSSGEITYSFPADDLEKMQILLMKRVIEDSLNNVEEITQNKTKDISHQLEVLREAHEIISPVPIKNSLNRILEIRNKSKDAKDILYDDITALLSPEAIKFFNERIAETSDNLPYTQKITDLYADIIREAPKEKFNEILDTLVTAPMITHRLCGEDKLMRAFLDNPVFFEKLSQTIKSYEAFPENSQKWDWNSLFGDADSNVRAGLLNMISTINEITEFKLKEHIEHGGNFDNFEQPFKKDLAKLFGFAPEGDIDEDTALKSLRNTRNKEDCPTLYEQAYMLYSSYDALKSNDNTNIEFLLGYNCAGTDLTYRRNACEIYLKSAEKYHIDTDEQDQIKERKEGLSTLIDKIHDRLSERIYSEIENGNISVQDISYMTMHNDENGSGVYGKKGFRTIVSNHDFEKFILYKIENGTSQEIRDSISSLKPLTQAYDNSKECDIYKEKIWPSIEKAFQRKDITIDERTKYFNLLSYHNIFASDYKRYYEVLIGIDGKSGLLAEINKTEDPSLRYECYEMLLDQYARVPDPEIRADIIKNVAVSIWQSSNFYNDITASKEERDALIEEVDYLKKSCISDMDTIEILKELSELTLSQKELSLAMKPDDMDIQASDSNAIKAAYGLDIVVYALQQYPETKAKIQDFLLGEGTLEEADDLVKSIQTALCKEHDKNFSPKVLDRYLNGKDIFEDLDYVARDYYNKLNSQSLLHFKKEFDAAPLEVKALIVNEIITNNKKGWVQPFQIVSKKLFADAGELGKVGSDFLYSYIAARPDSEKTFYLAAMMAAANNKSKSAANYVDTPYTSEERNLARGLRLFLENSGPAGTKLAQAMASYSEVPEFIRYEMQFAKSEANPPARWEIFSGNGDTMDKLSEYGALGKRRGSASFFVTYDLGDKIVKIMRRGAKLKADSEFAIYTEMLQTLSAEYQNISSFKRLVQNASENVHIETDLKIGEKQYEDAKKLYPESVTVNDTTFNIKVMDWVARGKDWAIMDKAQGVDFKELQEPYKTAAAKAVFSTELANMLSGKRFDSDRHGGQYKFDTQNNVIGVFDTGSMSMTEPTDKERQALGIVLARTLKALRHNQNVASAFSSEIDKVTNELYKNEIAKNKTVPPYLSEFQRGMLALNDFYESLTARDMAECMIKAMDNGKHQIHPQIVKAFKLEIKKILDSHNVSINDLLNPEKTDDLAPEARANRRIGKILFDSIFDSISEGKSLDISSDNAQKLVSRLSNSDTDLQIVKGVVRGAYAKLNPDNYTQKDREELGMFLYNICQTDLRNQQLKKGEALENIIAEVATKHPQMGEYTQNIMKLVSVMAKIPALSDDKLKKAATFVAFTDNDVARGFKKALSEDKSVGFAKRIMLKLAPVNLIPDNAKKMLIKAVSKRFVADYVSKQLSGPTDKMQSKSNNIEI